MLMHGLFFILLQSVKRLVVILFMAFAALLSCSEPERQPAGMVSEVNIDSLVADLDFKQVEKRRKEVEAAINALRKKVTFSGTILYAEQGRIIYEGSFGYKDMRRRKTEMTIDGQFQLASVSKMFTAEAIMLLNNQGKLDYDDKVCRYFPEFPYPEVSIRNLLNHRSGLSRYESLAHEHWTNKRKPIHNEDVLKLYAEHQPAPYFAADNGFHYCNTNYMLLASIVEKVSGQHFEDFMQKNIYDAIGMNSSFIYSMRTDTIVPTYIDRGVPGHDATRRGYRKSQNDYLNGVMGDKIMFSTVEDLYRFSQALDYSLLLPDSVQKEAFKPGSPKARRRTENYGFGWRLSTKHKNAVYHFGWWKGYRTFFIKDLEKNRVIIALTNTDKGPNGDYFWNIINSTTTRLAPADANVSYLEMTENITFPHHPSDNRYED